MTGTNFGRYELLEKLAAGGMGEVYRAKLKGVEGFAKEVAVKRIFPHLSKDDKYRRLFVREAKVVAGLVHPNIVQVHELGEVDEQLFIAMEFVHGIDLGRLAFSLALEGKGLASPLVAVVAFDILEALDFAHSYVDETGKSLRIVHQDVSPQNALIDVRSGMTKLCDFGIMWLPELTVIGDHSSVWGKVSYLSPERLDGAEPDPTADIFALGVVLWELLTCRRLFGRADVMDTLRAIRGNDVPALTDAAPDVSPALARVVHRALEPRAADRYQSAAEFRTALEGYLVETDPRAAREGLRELVRQQRERSAEPADGKVEESRETENWSSLVDRAATGLHRLPNQSTTPARPRERTEITVVLRPETARHAQSLARELSITEPSESGDTEIVTHPGIPSEEDLLPPRARSRPNRRMGLFGGGALLSGLAVGLWLTASSTDEPSPMPSPAPASQQSVREAALPAPVQTETPPAATETEPVDSIDNDSLVESWDPGAALKSKRPKAGRRKARTEPPLGSGKLNLNAIPWAHVTIDGRRLEETTPLRNLLLPAGEHQVELQGPAGQVRRLTITIEPDETVTRVVDLAD